MSIFLALDLLDCRNPYEAAVEMRNLPELSGTEMTIFTNAASQRDKPLGERLELIASY